MRPNAALERLAYVAKTYPDGNVLYWTVRAATELHGVHVTPPRRGYDSNADWKRAIATFVDEHEALREPTEYDRYLPWVAQQVNAAVKRATEHEREHVAERVGHDLMQTLRSIGDWANATGANLNRIDAETAIVEADHWANERQRESVPQGRIVKTFSDGYTIQRLAGQEQLAAEGEIMQHCVGSYCEKVESQRAVIYSVRDERGEPHVTIEWDPQHKRFVQIRGKQDAEPAKRYWPYVGWLVAQKPHQAQEPPEWIMEAVRAAESDVREVESKAQAANEELGSAVQYFNELDFGRAYDAYSTARRLENEYGDDPTTSQLELEDALQQIAAAGFAVVEAQIAPLEAQIDAGATDKALIAAFDALVDSYNVLQEGADRDSYRSWTGERTSRALGTLIRSSEPQLHEIVQAMKAEHSEQVDELDVRLVSATSWTGMDWTSEPIDLGARIGEWSYDSATFDGTDAEQVSRELAEQAGYMEEGLGPLEKYVDAYENSGIQ